MDLVFGPRSCFFYKSLNQKGLSVQWLGAKGYMYVTYIYKSLVLPYVYI